MVHLHLIAHFKPHREKWSLSQSLNFYVAVSAHFLESKDPVLKFCDNCLASRFSKEGSRDKSVFQSF